jgi:ABC-type cobalamin/Fe3+-siderophores transport system ATPase subunit
MINNLKLKFGSSGKSPKLEFDVTPITVFVGPNYSGKSLLIREIANSVIHGRVLDDSLILEEVGFRGYSPSEAEQAVDQATLLPNPGEVVQVDHVIVGKLGSRQQVHRASLVNALTTFHATDKTHHTRHDAAVGYLRYNMRMLDGRGRIDLANDQPFGDRLMSATTSFQTIFRNDELRNDLSEIVFDAFGQYLVFDPTQAGQIRLRLSDRKPKSLYEEQALTQEAADFHDAATLLGQASDGAKAFCGMLVEIMAGKPDLLLVDEPEAFLHPTLSFKLAKQMSKQMQGTNKRLFVSTHSPHFLMGCVSSGVPVNVIRLTYRNKVATARILPSHELATIMKNPLLRSAGVLSALFYENVVMTEGDSDRAFYQEVNERQLADVANTSGIPNCLFMNANGQDSIPIIMETLRKFGIPVAGVYDLDFIKDGGGQGARRLTAASIPDGIKNGLNPTRVSLKASLEAKNMNYKRHGGLGLLEGSERETGYFYLKQLAQYGVFLVPNGEVESWLPDLQIKGKSDWLVRMFERMGSDDANPDYVTPAKDDVWHFLVGIREWLLNSSRLGIPI